MRSALPKTRRSILLTLTITLSGAGSAARAEPYGQLMAGPPAQHVGGQSEQEEVALSFDWFYESGGSPPAGHEVGVADQDRFRPVRGNGSLGFRTGTVWLRFRVVYDGDGPAVRILQLGFMPVLAVLYRQEGERLVSVAGSGGDRLAGERSVQDSGMAFGIQLQPHQESTFWLRLRSDDVVWARGSLLTEGAYRREVALRSVGQGLYYGILLALIIYNGFIFLSTRERTYLLYTLFEVAMVVLQASQDKVAFQYLWPRVPAWAARCDQLFGGVTMLAALAFTVAFLDLPRYVPRLARLLRTLMVLAAAVAIASPLTIAPLFENAVGLFLIACVTAVVATAAIAAARGQPNARFFLVAWIPLLAGAVHAILGAMGLVVNVTAFLAFKVGSAAEATLLALALANRIKLITRARERADAALVAAKSAHAAALEARVAARTRDLSEALSGLKRIQDKLMRQERLTALAGMVAGMAHEVGNPLNFAQGGAEALADQIDGLARAWSAGGDAAAGAEVSRPSLETLRRALSLVQSGLHRIGRIMANLNGYMQLRTLETEPTDLVAEIESTLTIVDETLVRRGITVVRRLEALPPFPCRPGELNQVFMNIVLNACGAMSSGGRLEITTRSDPREGLEIEFADDGPGVSPEHREAIFEPFFSERAIEGAGCGLGLYIAREIVSRHGGHLLLLDSHHGARFAVRLPLPAGPGGDQRHPSA